MLSYGFRHVAVATGARWRADGVGRRHTFPLELAGVEVLTPDDLLAGTRPQGDRVVLYDDDEYYLGGVLAELLTREGRQVTLVTQAAHASAWSINTMDQPRIQRRLLELGVTLELSHSVLGASAGEVLIECAYTERERQLPCDALVLVTARLPNDGLGEELLARRADWAAAGVDSVRIVGDAYAPGTIASAVWDGHRFAEELDGPEPDDAVPFRREVTQLLPVVQ